MKRLIAALALSLIAPLSAARQLSAPPDQQRSGGASAEAGELSAVLNSVTMRNIGPFRPGSWVTSIAIPDTPAREHLYTIYAGARSGGVWKTTNNGITWANVTDSAGIASVGAVAVAPSDGRVVWVGTGDQANARSSISGMGMFKSTDAGATWTFMGLPESHHIARIVIHPQDPNTVFVAAMGHLYSRNDERGVFKTTDGGAHWKKVLYVNDGVGAIDLAINPQHPSVLYAAMYDKERMPWQIIESGPESGVYRSDDGGETWARLTNGLPAGKIGRIGLDVYRKDPQIVYALLENQNPKPAAGGAPGPVSSTSPLAQGIIGNELYRTDDGGRSWRKVSGDVNVAGGKAPYSFNQIEINPFDDQQLVVNSDSMFQTRDGGKTWTQDFMRRTFGDFRCMWWDPQDEDRVMACSDGGVSVSYDRGATAEYFPNIRAGEAYALGVDMDDPYHVYAGFQDHDSWKGPVNSRWGQITLEDWVTVGPGDGMYNVVDPTDSRWVYNTRELNSMGRMDQTTGVRTDISPGRANTGNPPLRYNWIAPIAMAPSDPKTIYAGAQMLFRSKDRGDHWEAISPDLTTNDPAKLRKNVPFCTITSISESPITPGLIWVGTDDGKVQVTRDAGGAWTDATPALTAAGAPADRWVSRVFASPHQAGTAFVAKNGYRFDDFRPYLYRTTDYGATWTSIAGDLPTASINVVVQDRRNANLLFVGNDKGVWISIDAGAHWTRLKANLPTVAVHDLTIHPREHDLVLATYGRALWTGDVSFLEELTPAVLASAAYLFDIEPKARYGFGSQGMNYELPSDKYIEVPNEPEAITVNYLLKADAPAPAKLTITDAQGRVVSACDGPAKAGMNRVPWSLAGGPCGAGGGRGGRGGGGRGAGPASGPPAVGTYTVTIDVAGQTLSKPATVRKRIGN